jgi:hypothetical protein
LREFVHRDAAHVFGRPVGHAGETLACDGHIALRVTRGHWMDSDWPEASAAYLARFPLDAWKVWPDPAGEHWREMDDERGRIAAARSGDVRIGKSFLASLEQARLLARLPRCEVWTAGGEGEHLKFRFSGGTGIVGFLRSRHWKGAGVRLSILSPSYHYDGTPKTRGGKVDLGLKNWPPPPPDDGF